jgi:hypothetical protein
MKQLFTIFFSLVVAVSFAQYPTPKPIFDDNDTMPNDSVIISEIMLPNDGNWGYMELTNLSHDTVEMANFFTLSKYAGRTNEPFEGNGNKVNLRGTVLPGESYLIVYPRPQPLLLDERGELVYKDGLEVNREVIEMADTVFTYQSNRGGRQFVLLSRYKRVDSLGNVISIDSAAVDVFNSEFRDDNPSNQAIAGLGPGVPTYTLWHRKTSIKKGNINWNNSRGDDVANSEWIYTSKNQITEFNDFPFTTIKKHFKNETLNVTSKGRLVIDMNNKKIVSPYGIRRDSVFRNEFNIGPNVAWDLILGADSTQFYLQTNDVIEFMLPGDSVIKHSFSVEVQTKPESFVQVRPLLYKSTGNNYTYRYTVSNGVEPMDTIGKIPFDLRVDTFFKYLIIEPGTTAEIIPANGVKSPDLKNGDILKVTSANNSTKNYKLCVEEYVEGYKAELKEVIFPGLFLWENPETFYMTDTFLLFSTLSYNYNIELPEETELSPAIIGVPVDPNASISIRRAKNLSGSAQDRTTTIRVITENKKDTLEYTFTFSITKPTPELSYTPFFSDFGFNWAVGNNAAIQIYNPSDDLIDMGDYLITQFRSAWGTVGEHQNKMLTEMNRWSFRAGYMVKTDELGKAIFAPDFNQTSLYTPAKSVFSLINFRCYPYEGEGWSVEEAKKVDYRVFKNNNVLPRNDAHGLWPDFYGTKTRLFHGMDVGGAVQDIGTGGSTMILKITNDSVKDGTKAMNADFLNDYEIVDVVNGWNSVGVKGVIYDIIEGKDTLFDSWDWWGRNMYRKPNVYKGNPVERGSFGIGTDSTTVKPGEWVMYGWDYVNKVPNNTEIVEVSRRRFENHVMDYKEHIASVSSVVYSVTPGIEGEQDIYGIPSGITVGEFMQNIILADAGARIKVMNGDVEKLQNETLNGTDQLWAYSNRGIDSVIYNLNIGALDNNIALTSADYTIEIAGDKKTATIKGIPYGISITEALSKITKPELAKLAVTDGAETVIPLKIYSKDTIKIQNEEFTDVVIGDHVYFEVTAQNGDICLYDLVWETAVDPFVLSNVYVVNQDNKEINFVDEVSINTFLSNLIAGPGCTMKVVNKTFIDREKGTLKWDDRLVVSNGSKTVSYFIKFSEGNSYVRTNGIKTSAMARVYPNPSSGIFTIENIEGTNLLKVYNLTGNLIQTVNVNDRQAMLNISNQPHGVYLIKAEGKMPFVLKLVKE